MKEFKNIRLIGILSAFSYKFRFDDTRHNRNRPYFETEYCIDNKLMVVRLSGKLTEAYEQGKIKVEEIQNCEVINLDYTKKNPEYVLKAIHLR